MIGKRLRRGSVGWLLVACIAVVAPSQLTSPALAATPARGENSWVASTLGGMSLEQKVGQLFVVSAYGLSVDDPTPATVQKNQAAYGVDNFAQLIQRYHLGGIVYFGANTQSPEQVLNLSNGIQQVATAQPGGVPAVIGADQEGGLVVRMPPPATMFPGNMALGATRDKGLAYQNAQVMGQELRAVGINTDYAPVVDVNTNPLNEADGSRAFGDQTNLVSQMGAAQVLGFQSGDAGPAATAKHFPGLGSAGVNSDIGPVTSSRTLAELRRIDLPPFYAAAAVGTKQVMSSHLSLPSVDPSGLPTSLSPQILTCLLRNQIRYDGVVVTDSLQAGAIKATGFTPAEVAVRAINAGNDQLLETAPSTGLADLGAAYNGVLQAVQGGQITTARLDQSVARILRLKWRLGLVRNPFADPARLSSIVGTPAHLALAQQTAERSITLLENQGQVLPLAPHSATKVLVAGWQISGLPTVDILAAGISARGLATTTYPTPFHPTAEQIAQAVAAAQLADVVVAVAYNAWDGTPRKDQVTLVEALVATGRPVVAVALNAPYDVAYFPGVRGFLDAFSYQPVSLNAAVRVIMGEVNPSGKLPVTVTEPPPSTNVLYPFGFGLSYPA